MFLHCMLRSSVVPPPPPLVVFLLDPEMLSSPCMYGLDGPEPPHRSQTSMLLHGDRGALAYLYFACWFCWPTHPRWRMRVEEGTEVGEPTVCSCVPTLNSSTCPA